MPTKNPQLLLTMSEAQKAALERAAAVAGASMSQFVLMALSRIINDFPLDLPGQGESNQPEDVILTVRFLSVTHAQIDRVQTRPERYFRRLYRADLRAGAYLLGNEWTNDRFNMMLKDLEQALALEAMGE